jgi:ribose transport system permease protein
MTTDVLSTHREGDRSQARRLLGLTGRYPMVIILVALVIAAGILYSGFFNTGNLENLLSQNVPVGLVAIGMTYVIMAGGFDLSVASILAAGGVCFAKLSGEVAQPLAVLLTVLLGCAFGAINGLIVTKLRVNSFVTTLGTASAFGGATLLYTKGSPIAGEGDNFSYFGFSKLLGINVSTWLLLLAFIVFGVVLACTVYGRRVYAVGGNIKAARLSGIRTDRVRVISFIVSGACAALGGIVLASVTGVGQAGVDPTVTLDSIAIVIIGGTSLFGGQGSMALTAVGFLILAVINNVFNSLAWATATQQLILGVVVVLAVAIDSLRRR